MLDRLRRVMLGRPSYPYAITCGRTDSIFGLENPFLIQCHTTALYTDGIRGVLLRGALTELSESQMEIVRSYLETV